MRLSAHGTSHPGRRTSNEDAFLVDVGLGLFVVADGMGGHKAGEVAARLAVDAIHDFIQRSGDAADVAWPFGVDPSLTFDANRLRSAVRVANCRVLEASASRADYSGMGTTVVAALAAGDRLLFVGVGDSRVYLCRHGGLEQLTQDDSWVATVLAREPGVSEATLAHHPLRHVLTSVIGGKDDTEPLVEERTFDVGDVVLLCSDGLHGSVSVADIAATLAHPWTAEQLTSALVSMALERGASDNVTAVAIRREA